MTSQQFSIAHGLRILREQERILAWFPQPDSKPLALRPLNRQRMVCRSGTGAPDYAKRARIAAEIRAHPTEPIPSIARRLGCSASTVHKVKMGAPTTPPPPPQNSVTDRKGNV